MIRCCTRGRNFFVHVAQRRKLVNSRFIFEEGRKKLIICALNAMFEMKFKRQKFNHNRSKHLKRCRSLRRQTHVGAVNQSNVWNKKLKEFQNSLRAIAGKNFQNYIKTYCRSFFQQFVLNQLDSNLKELKIISQNIAKKREKFNVADKIKYIK